MTSPAIGKLLAAFLALLLGAALLNAEPPALEALADVSQETKTEIKVALKAKDGADKPLRFAIAKVRQDGKDVPAPRGMTLHTESGAFAWTPTPSQVGRYEITFAVKDAKDQESTATLKVTVKERPISAMNNEVGKLLLKWQAEGTAAGNTGDFYDNRDGEHSPLGLEPWPQLDKVQYTEDEFRRRVNWAAAHTILKHVTFGNSSTSAPVLNGGSNPRHYYINPRGMPFLYEMYRANNVYIYPGHHDHHPGHNGKPQFYGDVYFTNSPYLFISQGSSGTDQPFMRAIPSMLAAFRPEVKKKLIETGLLMPTIQMLLRTTNKHLQDPKEYLTGKAHPTVFEGSWVNDLAMVQSAHAITADTIPPMVQLKVVEEDTPQPSRDFFEGTEKLHDTPCVISRIVRGPNYVRRLVVSAEGSFDVNKKPLTFHWAVLRGDNQRITIKPLNDSASVVEIKVPYHDRYTIDSPVKIETNRVDIGAFVHNGASYSAPGFVTLYTLDNEARTYDKDGKLLEIGYGVGDADFSVTDWHGLFAMFQAEAKDFPGQLLHRQFKDVERAELAKAGLEYKTASEKLTAAQAVNKKAVEARNQAQATLKSADDKLKAAKKTYEDDGSDANFDTLKEAIRDQAAAGRAGKIAEAEFQTAQKATDAASKAANDILTQKRAGLDVPVRSLVDAALNRMRDNPKFYLENRQALEALLPPADQSRKDRLTAARKRLVELGILQPDKDRFVLQSIRKDGPPAERLTTYEQNALARFHADVLSTVVYPKLVAVNFQVNFVDQRLTTPKFWRDIYRYDARGNRLGWLRRDGETETEFNADGHAVLEKDALGRTVKARSVRYELDPAALKSNNVRVLKPVWGDKVLTYEYAGDDDFKGKVAKEEANAENK